jgi:hypothetical protein
MVLSLTCAAVLLCAVGTAQAQAPETKPEPAAPGATNGQPPKPEPAEPPKTEPQAPPAPESGEAPAAGTEEAPASLGDLTREGFEIITTNFIPAEAVTRQSGKVSSDAVVVTLQKQNATAVCFYTLKAYVGKKLTAIPACTVHR